MASIELYKSKINSMSNYIAHAKSAVSDFCADLSALKKKVLGINSSVCDSIVSSISSSSKTQEQLIEGLEATQKEVDAFIKLSVERDKSAADEIIKQKKDFYKKYSHLKPESEKSRWEKFCDKLKKVGEWCKAHWKKIALVLGIIAAVAFLCVPGLHGIGVALLGGALKIAIVGGIIGGGYWVFKNYGRKIKTFFNSSGHPQYIYDSSDPCSMADCLGIDYDEYHETMRYNYGFEDELSDLYLKLYLKIANDPANAYMNEKEVACEFNRMIASLCINYDGSAVRWHLTTGNYSTADAYQMLMDDYGFSKAQASDFVTALNIQHGNEYYVVMKHLKGTGYSRFNGNLYRDVESPSVENFQKSAGNHVMKDFVHEAVQFAEFNDSWDIVDFGELNISELGKMAAIDVRDIVTGRIKISSGSTDRMISYSGDITSTRYDAQDFQSDIDANNVQARLRSSNNNFIRVQQDYNNGVMNGKINSRAEFINNNGGIDNIRNNINSDIRSFLGGYITGRDYYLKPNKRVGLNESRVQEFIDFLEQPE